MKHREESVDGAGTSTWKAYIMVEKVGISESVILVYP